MIDVRERLKAGEKVRMKSWWWGRCVKGTGGRHVNEYGEYFPGTQIPSGKCDKWEVYDEELHGRHHRDPIDAKYEDEYLKSIGKYRS